MFTGECLLSAQYSITGFMCVTACEYVRERKMECALSSVFYRPCWWGAGLYQSQTIYSLPSSLSSLLPQPNPQSLSLLTFIFFPTFFSSLGSCPIQIQTGAVYWGCDTAQINTLALFTKTDFLVYNAAPETSSSGQQWSGWWEVWLGSRAVDTTKEGCHNSLNQ